MKTRDKSVRQILTISDYLILILILTIGVVFFILGGDWSNLGILSLISLLCMIPFCRHGYRIKGERGIFSLKEVMVAKECKDEILAYIDGSSDTLIHNPHKNGGAVVNIYTQKNNNLIKANYFDYADYLDGKEYDLHTISAEKKERLLEIDTQFKKAMA